MSQSRALKFRQQGLREPPSRERERERGTGAGGGEREQRCCLPRGGRLRTYWALTSRQEPLGAIDARFDWIWAHWQ